NPVLKWMAPRNYHLNWPATRRKKMMLKMVVKNKVDDIEEVDEEDDAEDIEDVLPMTTPAPAPPTTEWLLRPIEECFILGGGGGGGGRMAVLLF
ncbi:hypothetical protein DOY81_012390, partial [Sarcophaga bullata]